MRKNRPFGKEEAPSASPKPPNETAPSREQLVSELSHEAENFILSDAVFNQLRFIKKAIPIFYTYLSRERRRKKRSKQFQWFLVELFRSDSPVDSELLANFRDLLQLMRKQMEGEALPPDTGERTPRHLKNLAAIRKEPTYWREYRAYCNGKLVSEILREFHPAYDQLHGWDREKYFRKIYNAIQRLVEKYGGPPLTKTPPPQQP
jgi:hypothetical protein